MAIVDDLWLGSIPESNSGFLSKFWSAHKSGLQQGGFWADRIKDLRGNPVARLRLAIENLPLPAAFREATIALRGLLKESDPSSQEHADQLVLLYWLAAVDSFSIPYSSRLQEPGFNVFSSIPGSKIVALDFTFHELGYNELPLLKKTDIKRLVARWGEPLQHSTLHKLHKNAWDAYEDALLQARKKDKKSFMDVMGRFFK